MISLWEVRRSVTLPGNGESAVGGPGGGFVADNDEVLFAQMIPNGGCKAYTHKMALLISVRSKLRITERITG